MYHRRRASRRPAAAVPPAAPRATPAPAAPRAARAKPQRKHFGRPPDRQGRCGGSRTTDRPYNQWIRDRPDPEARLGAEGGEALWLLWSEQSAKHGELRRATCGSPEAQRQAHRRQAVPPRPSRVVVMKEDPWEAATARAEEALARQRGARKPDR